MLLLIDQREGSKKLLDKFPGECESALLEAGDIAFWGIGPENKDWLVGIEYKTLDDFCASAKSGRLTGTQLPGMLRIYNICFLLIEGIGFMDRRSGQLFKKIGMKSYGLGLPYKGYQNFMTAIEVHSALSGRPCIVKRTIGTDETVSTIRSTYEWFQKPWEQHTAMSRPDLTKIQRISYDLEVQKVDPDGVDYPKYWLRKALFQLERMGWDIAGSISSKFCTMESIMTASQKDFESVDRVGKGLASRLYKALHGHDDPETLKRKRRKGENANGENASTDSVAG